MMAVKKFVWRVNLVEPKMDRKDGRKEGRKGRGWESGWPTRLEKKRQGVE
jgi:hypothetical protein